ncbi:MAG: hypothetical protein HQK96_09585 [Nitrospirae bacterium]|nr:hypothetical protein [Nitrospirota bacterium]
MRSWNLSKTAASIVVLLLTVLCLSSISSGDNIQYPCDFSYTPQTYITIYITNVGYISIRDESTSEYDICSTYKDGTSLCRYPGYHGRWLTMTAEQQQGYGAFKGWTGCDVLVSNTVCKVQVCNDNGTVTAAFAPSTSSYTLSVTKSGTGTGTVTSSPSGIICGSTCSAAYSSGTSVTLTATAASGSTFSGWTGCDSTSGTACTVAMSSGKSVAAAFTLSVSSDFTAASTAVDLIYNQYSLYLGTKSGSVLTGTTTSGTYYIQWFTNGMAIVALSDGHMYYWDGYNVYDMWIIWSYVYAANTAINAVYNEYSLYLGTKSGSVLTGTTTNGTYYIQWFTNGMAIVAFSDGYMYYWDGYNVYNMWIKWN